MVDIVEQDGTSYNLANSSLNPVANNPIGTSDTARLYGRQISSGNIRGNQNITGTFTVSDIASGNTVASIDGTNDNILITNPTTKINQIIMGALPDKSYGMWVSKNGIDVTTATAAELTFNSNKSFTIFLSGNYTFPSSSVLASGTNYATTQVIPHNAGYTPATLCYGPAFVSGSISPPYPPDFPSNLSIFLPSGQLIYQLGLAYMIVYYGADSTNFYLGMAYINDTAGTVTVLGANIEYFVYSYTASS